MTKNDLIGKMYSKEITPEQAVQEYDRSLGHGRKYRPKDKDARVASYQKSRALREEIRKKRIPFITPNFLPDFFLCQGMILVGGLSGKGKSTAAANVLAGYLKSNNNGTAIVITNEENTDSIYDRVSCILCGVSYVDFLHHKLKIDDESMVIDTSLELTKQIEVVEDEDWDMSYIEDVQSVLEHAASSGVGMVIIDYYQTINASRKDPHAESYMVLKRLGFYLKDYGRKYGIPVVVFAQLNPSGETSELQSRVQNDRTVFNHAFTVIEIVPDFETNLTTFIMHKDRFSNNSGREVIMKYDRGRYIMDRDMEI